MWSSEADKGQKQRAVPNEQINTIRQKSMHEEDPNKAGNSTDSTARPKMWQSAEGDEKLHD